MDQKRTLNQSPKPTPVHPDVALAVEFYDLAFPAKRPNTLLQFLTMYASSLEESFEERHGFVFTLSRTWDPEHREREEDSFFRRRITQDQAKLITAREHGFANWDAVVRAGDETIDEEFELAADDVVHGRVESLKARIKARPSLVTARSTFGHRATLLHYLAANGVEFRRQLAPHNGTDVAEVLLSSGAAPDELAETYGGGAAQTTLCLLVTSAHPHRANTANDLIQVLLDNGAALEGVDDDGLPLRICTLHGYTSSLNKLIESGAQVSDLYLAAAAGDLNKLNELVARQSWREVRTIAWTYSFARDKAEQANGDVYSILQRSSELADLHGRLEIVALIQSIRNAYTEALDRFDKAWSEQSAPPIYSFIPDVVQGAFTQRLICDLVNIDLDYRWSTLPNRSTSDGSRADTSDTSRTPYPSESSAQSGLDGVAEDLGERPRIEEYYPLFPELARFQPLPLFLIKEEYRVRYEAGDQPTPAEFIDRFPEYSDVLPEQLEHVLKEEADLFPTLSIDVYHKKEKAFSTAFDASLEIGRRRPDEPAPYVIVDTGEGRRLIIADLQERFMSRSHLQLEPLTTGRVKATNLSGKNAISMPLHLETLAPGDSREFIPPVAFVVQTKTIRISIGD